ncbi:hypothetical protein B0H14DRAFT_2646196, partial [Mycena olivaceomarginata]
YCFPLQRNRHQFGVGVDLDQANDHAADADVDEMDDTAEVTSRSSQDERDVTALDLQLGELRAFHVPKHIKHNAALVPGAACSTYQMLPPPFYSGRQPARRAIAHQKKQNFSLD